MQKILITGSTTPDIDAVACAIGYQYFLTQKDTTATYIAGAQYGMHPEASFVCEQCWLAIHDIQANDQYDSFILVDASEQHWLPSVVDFFKVQEVIDHRMFPDYAAFPEAKFRIEPVGAAATQIAEFFYFDRTISLSPAVAQLLLCAIYSNTVNFKADVTTFRDLRMKQWLETLVDDKNLYEYMFTHKTTYILDNLEEVLHAENKTVNAAIKLFQLELYDVSLLLQNWNLKNIAQKIAGDTPYTIIILQDIKYGKTSLVPLNTMTRTLIEQSGVPWSRHNDIWIIPQIMMRKSLIPYLRK